MAITYVLAREGVRLYTEHFILNKKRQNVAKCWFLFISKIKEKNSSEYLT